MSEFAKQKVLDTSAPSLQVFKDYNRAESRSNNSCGLGVQWAHHTDPESGSG